MCRRVTSRGLDAVSEKFELMPPPRGHSGYEENVTARYVLEIDPAAVLIRMRVDVSRWHIIDVDLKSPGADRSRHRAASIDRSVGRLKIAVARSASISSKR